MKNKFPRYSRLTRDGQKDRRKPCSPTRARSDLARIPSLRLILRKVAAAAFLVAVLSQVASADTPDLTEFLSGSVNVWRCAGAADSLAVFADVDGNSVNDTLVVFTSIQGEAQAEGPNSNFGYGSYLYFFTGDRSNCGGATGGVGRIGIRFVDMLAPGFNAGNPATWTYKSVPGVQLVVASDLTVEDGSGTPYRQVNAYSQTNGGGTLIGSFTTGTYPDTANEIQTCDFTSALGVKEIQVRTDFAENDVRYFVIHSSATSGGSDAGLRVYDGSANRRIACEFPGTGGALNSDVRFSKNGTNYGIILTDTNSAIASRIRVQTSSGVKSWALLP